MANIYDVADFFVHVANAGMDDSMTNLKVNKLAYYAQGTFLARYGRKLFEDRIIAWKYGPVVEGVYKKYKPCGKNPITDTSDGYTEDVFSPDELRVLMDVMNEYGKYTGEELIRKTHAEGTPWSACEQNAEIPTCIMETYFKSHPTPSPRERKLKYRTVKVLPKEYDSPEDDELYGDRS